MTIYQQFRHTTKKALVRLGYYKKPEFLIIGAQKAGTTLVYSILSQHPAVLRPAFKEAHFFDWESNYKKGYVQFFKNFELPYRYQKGQITFEATPDYLPGLKVAERIHRYLPDCKFIIVLRDPVSRAYSAWNMHHSYFPGHPVYDFMTDKRDFETAAREDIDGTTDPDDVRNYISRGKYAQQIKRFHKYFDPARFLIIDNKELYGDKQRVVNEITAFLNIPSLDLSKVDEDHEMFWENKGKYSQKMDEGLQQELYRYFKPYDQELKDLTGRDFSWFNKTIYAE